VNRNSLTVLLFLAIVVSMALVGHYLWKPILALAGLGFIAQTNIAGMHNLNLVMLGAGLLAFAAAVANLRTTIQPHLENEK